jgi:hypothetical protein
VDLLEGLAEASFGWLAFYRGLLTAGGRIRTVARRVAMV